MRLFSCLDLFALKALGATAVEAGHYGAAQALANVPGFLAMALPTVVVSTVSRHLAARETELAVGQALGTLRFVVGLLPFAALAAGSASDIARVVYGELYAPAGLPMAFLIVAALARVMVQVSGSLLTAAGRPGWNLWLMVPPVFLALLAYPLVIPSAGMAGAAAVHTTLALAAAVVSVAVLPAGWRVARVLPTCLRTLLISVAVFHFSWIWESSGVGLLAELVALSALAAGGFWALGEFRPGELQALGAGIFRKGITREEPVVR